MVTTGRTGPLGPAVVAIGHRETIASAGANDVGNSMGQDASGERDAVPRGLSAETADLGGEADPQPADGAASVDVLLLAEGGPDRAEDVADFARRLREESGMPAEVAEALAERYAAIGGSPLLRLTRVQAAALEARLNADARTTDGTTWRLHIAMRHWHPLIEDVVGALAAEGVTRVVGLPMTPHYSPLGSGSYHARAAAGPSSLQVVPIERWHLLGGYLDALADRVRVGLARFPEAARAQVPVVFAVSGPQGMIAAGDDAFRRDLQETVFHVARRIAPQPYTVAFPGSAGPALPDVLQRLADEGARHALVVPIGSVTEHVDTLYDVDIEARRHAEPLAVRLERIEMLNDHPILVGGLADLVRARAAEAGLVPIPAAKPPTATTPAGDG